MTRTAAHVAHASRLVRFTGAGRAGRPGLRPGTSPGRRAARVILALATLSALTLIPAEGWAQAATAQTGPAREMRHFWHVFIAFALAWILVFGWVVSIVRRLRRVEDSLR